MRDKFIAIRVSEEEKEAAERLANISRRTVSSLFRLWLSLEVDKHISLADAGRTN